jgi:hypothetical protein
MVHGIFSIVNRLRRSNSIISIHKTIGNLEPESLSAVMHHVKFLEKNSKTEEEQKKIAMIKKYLLIEERYRADATRKLIV